MQTLDDKYRKLTQNYDLLSDRAILAQAWKKTDNHLRNHSWYADVLELESIAISLPRYVEEWASKLARPKYTTKAARLVEAPKSAQWNFTRLNKWQPATSTPDIKSSIFTNLFDGATEAPSTQKLRPLAHLSVADQVSAMSVLLCTADAVETAQGSTNPDDYEDYQALRKKVVSYGNRLFCDWSKGPNSQLEARYRWGSTTIYSKYFQDYERFLERPLTVCQYEQSQLDDRKLFVIKLDFRSFFDSIDQHEIVPHLKDLCARHDDQISVSDNKKERFWSSTKNILKWSWEDSNPYELGIPQGLVAGGFFANAFMNKFDESMKELIARRSGIEGDTKIIDYCRYVDDIRIVVSASPEKAIAPNAWVGDIQEDLTSQIKEIYGAETCLRFNESKTSISAWEDLALQSQTSSIMNAIGSAVSTAPDPATLAQATGSLTQLLSLAESIESADYMSNTIPLSNIAKPNIDIKDETIKRFAAHRLRKTLALRRSMAESAPSSADTASYKKYSERELVDHEIESTARKLVACWSRNPSLVTVLRCAFDMYPSVEILKPVLLALQPKLLDDDSKIFRSAGTEGKVAAYVLSEIYRSAATGMGSSVVEPDSRAERLGPFREALMATAHVLVDNETLPWYLQQQVLLFLAVMDAPQPAPPKRKMKKELEKYYLLHSLLLRKRPTKAHASKSIAPFMVAYQLSSSPESLIDLLGQIIEIIPPTFRSEVLADLSRMDSSLIDSLKRTPSTANNPHVLEELGLLTPLMTTIDPDRDISTWPKGKLWPLSSIIKHPQNPFTEENALLKLTSAIVAKISTDLLSTNLHLESILIGCDDWRKIQDPKTEISVNFSIDSDTFNSDDANDNASSIVKRIPKWCKNEMRWAYSLGRIIRAAAQGQALFAPYEYASQQQESKSLRRLNTLHHRRLLGIPPMQSGTGDNPSPLSPWMNELMLMLLQWPGIDLDRGASHPELTRINTPHALLIELKKRIKGQQDIYGVRSNLPVYVLPVSLAKNSALDRFKVAIVQTVLPDPSDISDKQPLFWKPEFRARHRAHLASMSRLLQQQLISQGSLQHGNRNGSKRLDLILFPELSVHPDDMWILERLSDATGASIFAGQTYVCGPNGAPINRGVWLLRRDSSATGRQFSVAYQGKEFPTPGERAMGIASYRPFQLLVEFTDLSGEAARLSSTICFDSTDLDLAADLRSVSDGLLISALNKDVPTFDTMVQSLNYHMFQPVVLANSGIYGGSTAQAPFSDRYERTIAHLHGKNQAAVSVFELDLNAFSSVITPPPARGKKSPPAGYEGRR